MAATRTTPASRTPRRRAKSPNAHLDPAPTDDSRPERILEAAIDEFQAKGLAGARVAEIARKSDSNKQLIYYYFDSKIGLYDAAMRRMVELSNERLSKMPADESFFDRTVRQNADVFFYTDRWFRYWMWEALEGDHRPISHEVERRKVWRRSVAQLVKAQDNGEIDEDFDPRMLTLALHAIIDLPHMLPQLTRLIVGLEHDDPEFEARQAALLAQLLDRLRPTS